METATMTNQTIYSSSDVATLLKIQESTLRKYSLMLEEAGYSFHKNDQGHRGYFEKDVISLKKLVEIKKHPDMTLKQACNAVMAWVNNSSVSHSDTNDIAIKERHTDRYNDLFEEFKDYKKQQEDFNKMLLEKLDQQYKYIENSINKRDEQLLTALRESQETKKLLLESKEEERQPKGFWSRIFGGK